MTGAVKIDLSEEPSFPAYREDRYALGGLRDVPDGATVIVDIGERDYVTQDAAVWLHEHADRLLIEIVGTKPAAVMQFVQAARAGEWSVI